MRTVTAILAIASARAFAGALALLQTIPLPGVRGRIDHLAADMAGQRLFVAALGNNSVEVLDLRKGRVASSLRGLDEPQGLAYVPAYDRLYVACGGDGSVKVFGGPALRPLKGLGLGADADNVRSAGSWLYVGYGSGGIALLDPGADTVLSTIKLGGHPEAFEVEPGGGRVFANVPGQNAIAVLDPAKGAVLARWTAGRLRSNFPMALDEGGHRLFVGIRWPAVLRIFDTGTGRRLAELPIGGDVDDIFFDPRTRMLYLACGQGFLDIIRQVDPDHYARMEHMPTSAGARTCLLLPQTGRLYLAVPERDAQPATIRVYATGPGAGGNGQGEFPRAGGPARLP